MVTPNSLTGWAVTFDSAPSLNRPSDLPADSVSTLPSSPMKVRFQGAPLTTFTVSPPVVSVTSAPLTPTSPSPLPFA